MKTSKKVIILDNINSTRIAQAIFILRDGAESDFSAVNEAERLAEETLGSDALSSVRSKRAFIKWGVFAASLLLLAALVLLCITF